MGNIKTIDVKAPNGTTYSYTNIFQTNGKWWTCVENNGNYTLNGPLFNWTFKEISSGSDKGVYYKNSTDLLTIQDTGGTISNYPFLFWDNNMSYKMPVIKTTKIANLNSITTTLNATYQHLSVKLEHIGKTFFFNYNNIDVFVYSSIQIAYDSIKTISVSEIYGGTSVTKMTDTQVTSLCLPTLTHEYSRRTSINGYCVSIWRGFKTLKGKNGDKQIVACLDLSEINTNYKYAEYVRYDGVNSSTGEPQRFSYESNAVPYNALSTRNSNTSYSFTEDANYGYHSFFLYCSYYHNSSDPKYTYFTNMTRTAGDYCYFYNIPLKLMNHFSSQYEHPHICLVDYERDWKIQGQTGIHIDKWTFVISERNKYVAIDYDNLSGTSGQGCLPSEVYKGSYDVNNPYSMSLGEHVKVIANGTSAEVDSMNSGDRIQIQQWNGSWYVVHRYFRGSETIVPLIGLPNLMAFQIYSTEVSDPLVLQSTPSPYTDWNNAFRASQNTNVYYWRKGTNVTPSGTGGNSRWTLPTGIPNGTYALTFWYKGVQTTNSNWGDTIFTQTYEITISGDRITNMNVVTLFNSNWPNV